MLGFPSGQRGKTQVLVRNASWVRIPFLVKLFFIFYVYFYRLYFVDEQK